MTGTTLLMATLQQATLTGVVRDSVDLEPVAFAHVAVAPAGGGAAPAVRTSDRFGAFVVPAVPAAGPVRIEVRAFGYAVWTRTHDPLPAEPLRVLLSPAPIELEGLRAAVSGRGGDPMSLSRGAFVIDSVLLRSLPTILETDVLRAMAVAPSASQLSDYVAIPFIRGGTSEGTPVLLDGVRLFNAFHLGGFVSAINAEVVDRATLLTGSGGDGLAIGSLSGAIDIATRDGARDRRRMAGSLGVASARFSVEGPAGETVSYLVSARRTWLDGFTAGLEKVGIIEGRVPYFFQHLHTKVTSDLGGVRRLAVSGYLNSESLTEADLRDSENRELVMTWGNAAFSGHYRDSFGPNWIIDAYLGHSRFRSDLIHLEHGHASGDDDAGTHESVPDTLLFGDGLMSETRADLRATLHLGRATVTAGTQATRFAGHHDYYLTGLGLPDIIPLFSVFSSHGTRWRLSGYTSVQARLPNGFRMGTGLRLDRFQRPLIDLAPYGELGYAASWWEVGVSASRSYQALASLRNEETLGASFLAYDLFVPVTEGPVPNNTELSIGWEGSRGGLRVRLDAYMRALQNLRLPNLRDNPIRATVLGDPSLWELGRATARGIEASWSWVWDRGVSVLGSYRWAKVWRTVREVTYAPRFHRDHEFELSASFRHGASSWSARVSLRSGQPFTPLLAIVPGPRYLGDEAALVPLAGEYNSARLPHYARMDIGWRRASEVSWFGGGSVVPYVSVANLLGRDNVVAWLMADERSTGRVRKVYRRQLPMVPFAGVEFRF